MPIPSAAAHAWRREEAIAVRATITKLGPGLTAPRRIAPSTLRRPIKARTLADQVAITVLGAGNDAVGCASVRE
jgi:hypothetical protein